MSLGNLIEIIKVRKASNYEPWRRFKAEFLSPAVRARLWLDSWLRHNAFRKPGLRTGLSQMQLQKSLEQYQKSLNLWWCSIKSPAGKSPVFPEEKHFL